MGTEELDYQAMTKAQLIKLLQQKEQGEAAVSSGGGEDEGGVLSELAAALMTQRNLAALVAGGGPLRSGQDTYEVTNIRGTSVFLQVTDSHTNQLRTIELDRRGAKARLTRAQVEEVRERSPHFFSEGFLHCDLVEDNPNAVRDIPAFIAALTPEHVDEAVARITSRETLFDLYNYIENQRFVTTDAAGRPLTVRVGNRDIPTVKEQALSPNEVAVFYALQRRIQELANVAIVTTS